MLFFFFWPPVLEVCPNYEVVVYQPWTGTPLDLGSVANCYVAIILIPDPPFSARHPMSTWGVLPAHTPSISPLLTVVSPQRINNVILYLFFFSFLLYRISPLLSYIRRCSVNFYGIFPLPSCQC